MSGKIGLGLITCNAVGKFKQSVLTVPEVDSFVIVNDGKPYDDEVYPARAVVIQHDKNYSVGKSKNDALRYLLNEGCEHIFLMEDDVLIKNPEIIYKYINASETTGILHLNYALQGPNNRKPKSKIRRRTDRILGKIAQYLVSNFNQSKSIPEPKAIVTFDNGVSISLYHNCVGAFSYYRKSLLEQTGFMDETFVNAWEHVEHTYQICKTGNHPPFWWFADVTDSINDIDNIDNVIEQSTIRSNPNWVNRGLEAEQYFESKIGCTPGAIPHVSREKIKDYFDQVAPNINKSIEFYGRK
jgi:hypothetical protein